MEKCVPRRAALKEVNRVARISRKGGRDALTPHGESKRQPRGVGHPAYRDAPVPGRPRGDCYFAAGAGVAAGGVMTSFSASRRACNRSGVSTGSWLAPTM